MITKEQMDKLYKSFEALKPGQHITILTDSILKETLEHAGTYCGGLEPYGYITKCGGWSLYGSELDGEIRCFSVLIKLYKRRNILKLRLGYSIKGVKEGWPQ